MSILYRSVLPVINIQVKFQFTIPTTNKIEHLIYQLNQFALAVSVELPLNLTHRYLNIINNKSLQTARDNNLCHISTDQYVLLIKLLQGLKKKFKYNKNLETNPNFLL